MAVAQQKVDLVALIEKKIREQLEEKPEVAADVALMLVRRLVDELTLEELREWHFQLYWTREELERVQ